MKYILDSWNRGRLSVISTIVTLFVALLFAFPATAGEITLGIATGGDPTEVEDVVGTAGTTALEVRGTVGYRFTDSWSVAAEYTYLPSQKFDRDDTFVLMGYYNFGDTLGARPFVGLGVGAALQGIDVEGGVGRAAVGFAVPITESIDLTTTYSRDIDLNGFDDAGESLMLGATFSF